MFGKNERCRKFPLTRTLSPEGRGERTVNLSPKERGEKVMNLSTKWRGERATNLSSKGREGVANRSTKGRGERTVNFSPKGGGEKTRSLHSALPPLSRERAPIPPRAPRKITPTPPRSPRERSPTPPLPLRKRAPLPPLPPRERVGVRVLFALLFALFALPALSQINLGVLDTDLSQWQSFLAQTGAKANLVPYNENALYQQVYVLGAFGLARIDAAEILTKWLPQIQGRLLDLSPYARDLQAAGVELYSYGNVIVGVRIPWREDAFVGILYRTTRVQEALAFLKLLRAPEAKVTPLSLSIGPLVVAKTPKGKPGVDGALEAFLHTLKQAVPQGLVTALSLIPAQARDAVRRVAEMWGIPISADGTAVTLVLEPISPISPTALGATKAESSPLGLQKAVVPLSQLENFLAQAAGRARVRLPFEPIALGVTSEGANLVGAAAFHAQGIRGAGVKIAVIDVGFAGLSQSQARGDLPYSLVTRDFTGTGIDTGLSHGTAVAEIVYDIAPAATLYLVKIANEVDLDNAVTYCITEGVSIIVHSLGWFNTSFYDGTGVISQIVDRAASAGILWVQAAGNFGLRHFGPTFTDANADGWHDTDVTLTANAGERILLYLTWDSWPATADDYDLFLFDPVGNLVASSTKTQAGAEQPTERIYTTATVSGTYRVRIQKASGAAKRLALFSVYQDITPYDPASSMPEPANAASALTVAAINWQNYTTGPAAPYSSRGPTRDGRAKPDLSAPDNVTTGVSYYNPFPGTSAAAPHVAGVAALMKSENPALTLAQLRNRILASCVAMGDPYTYGAGRLEARPAIVAQPDLVVDSITYSPATPTVGSTVSFTVVVRNQGNAPAGAFTVRLQGAGPSQDRTVSSLAAGATTNLSFSLPLSTSPETFTATADVLGQVAESNEGNNTRQVTVTGVLPTPQGRLATDKGTYVQGETVRITFQNTGSVGIELPNAAPWVIKNASGRVVFSPVAAQVIITVAPGETRTWTWDGRDNSGNLVPPGTYTVELRTNNAGTFTATFAIQAPALPDLVVDSITYSPSAPTIGTTLNFTVVVRNAGNAAAGQFTVRLQGPPGSQDRTVASLAAGASTSLSFSLALTTSPATFTATADVLGQVTESNEGNNTRQITVTAVQPTLPDLVVESVTYTPTNPTVGTTLAFTITVKNQGGASSGLFYVKLEGLAGAQYASISSLPAGSRATVALQLPLSAATETFTITADATNRVAESDETNNTYQVTVIAAQPPLSLAIHTDKTSYTVGEAMRITIEINRSNYYVYVVELDPTGKAILVFPNYWERDPKLPAGSTTLPRVGTYTIKASEPTGTERLYAFASDRAIPYFPTTFPTTSFPVLSTNGAAFLNQVRTWLSGNVPAGNWAEASTVLTVQPQANQPPVARFTYSPANPLVNQWITFDGRSSSDPDGTIVSWHWDFGDGSTASGDRVAKRYSAAGTYTVTLTVTDNRGATGSTSQPITVTSPNQAPVASFTFSPTNPDPGETVTFDASASTDPDGTIVSYTWDFGDGHTGSGVSVTHVYGADGTYTVTLKVTDDKGATASVSKPIQVGEVTTLPGMPVLDRPGIYVWGDPDAHWHITVAGDPSWTTPRKFEITLESKGTFANRVTTGAAPAPSVTTSGGVTRLRWEGTIGGGWVDLRFDLVGATLMKLWLYLDTDGDGVAKLPTNLAKHLVFLRTCKTIPPGNPFAIYAQFGATALLPHMDFVISEVYEDGAVSPIHWRIEYWEQISGCP